MLNCPGTLSGGRGWCAARGGAERRGPGFGHRVGNRGPGVSQPHPPEHRGSGSHFGRRSDDAGGAVGGRLEMAGEIVVRKRQQGRRQHI